ncbi:MAG: hypothetical protein ABSD57_03040 [Verrucomicrobiota bacterium]
MKETEALQVTRSTGMTVVAVLAAGVAASSIIPHFEQLPSETTSTPIFIGETTGFSTGSESQIATSVKTAPTDALAEKFYSLVNQWKRETGHFSVIARRYENPAYRAILDMRESAVPLILNELKRNPDRWFSALEKLTGENPAKDAVNFYEAVDRWVAWGIANEYIA